MSNMSEELQTRLKMKLTELDRLRQELKALGEKNRRNEAEIASLIKKIEARDLEREHYEKWFKHYEAENDKMLEVVPQLVKENDLLKQQKTRLQRVLSSDRRPKVLVQPRGLPQPPTEALADNSP